MPQPFETAWVRAVRPVLRFYPFRKGQVRLSSLLLGGSLSGPYPGPPESIIRAIPHGTVTQCRHGLKLRLQKDEAFIWPFLFGVYEEPNTWVYNRLIRSGDVVFDVGASYGWYSALFAKLVGTSGQVHAFEPVPQFASLAADTIALNGLDSIVELNVSGLGRDIGSFEVYTFSDLPMGHASSTRLGREDASPHESRVTTLDRYVAQRAITRVDFLKVDVEGDELDVFRGGEATLSAADAPIIAFEVNGECLADRSLTPSDVQQPLLEFGYGSFWEIVPGGGIQPVAHLGPTARSADYLAVKGNAKELLDQLA